MSVLLPCSPTFRKSQKPPPFPPDSAFDLVAKDLHMTQAKPAISSISQAVRRNESSPVSGGETYWSRETRAKDGGDRPPVTPGVSGGGAALIRVDNWRKLTSDAISLEQGQEHLNVSRLV